MNKQINPTRMEFLKLRKELETTKRGHKLLKDKQDEFMHLFIENLQHYKTLRNEVEFKLIHVINAYKQACVDMGGLKVNEILIEQTSDVSITYEIHKIMGTKFPSLNIDRQYKDLNYDFNDTTAAFDMLSYHGQALLELLITLVVNETKIEMMTLEIEKSKRRVNAIEHIVIKEIEEQMHVIKMKLNDLERSNTIRMMKSKEIVLNKNKEK